VFVLACCVPRERASRGRARGLRRRRVGAYVLAGRPAVAEGGGLDGGSGLGVLVGLLDEKGDAVLGGNDTDGLVGDLALVLAAVDVPQVKRVAGELDTVGTLDERCAVSLCACCQPQFFPRGGFVQQNSLVISQAKS
jgi:hypothetical protein